MAANWKSGGGIAKRLCQHISSRDPIPIPFITRRTAHASTYDKNLDDQVRPTVVPDEVIQPQSEKYWAPHPQTGVFGPATEQNTCVGVEHGFHFPPAKGEDSVLEEKAWFRPTSLEDLEKPHHP
ncbi:hypothetical protein SLA2020_021690 [Shorea laevis]